MSVITVRAADSATAMDDVARRLGPDALILSTRSWNGQIEIVASDGRDVVAPAAAPVRAMRAAPQPADEPDDTADDAGDEAPQGVAHGFAAYLARAVRPAGRAWAAPETLAEPAPNPAPAPAPASAPAPVAEAPAPAPRPAAPVHVIRPRGPGIGLADLLIAPRVVLVGPLGAGKSGLAIQIARARADRADPATLVPGFAFCGTGAYCDAAWLTQKAWLLGAETVVAFAAELPPPEDHAPDFVVVSDRHPDAVSAARQLKAADPATRVVLVLPAGLRADRAAAHAARWRGLADAAVLTLATGEAVEEADTEALRAAGLPAIAQSWRGDLMDGLGPLPVPNSRVARLHDAPDAGPQTWSPDDSHLTEIAG
ncbi:MAG: hypothetical protein N4A39_07645 [Roseicyclus sp.]|jgi:hypothetical protein|nr:hypothetical protein [Roseicyclus sp.]